MGNGAAEGMKVVESWCECEQESWAQQRTSLLLWTAEYFQLWRDYRAQETEYFLVYLPTPRPQRVLPISIASSNASMPVLTVALLRVSTGIPRIFPSRYKMMQWVFLFLFF